MPRKPKQGVLPGMAKWGAIPPSSPAGPPTEPEKLRDIAARAPMRIMAPLAGVEGIVSSGQFKTQHETGTAGPQATLDPRYRASWEDTAFGPGQRPVYGYFSHGDVRDITKTQNWDDDARFDQVSGYGHTAFELGEHMRKHTTYAWGDTLGGSSKEIAKQGEFPAAGMKQRGLRDDLGFSHADAFYTEMHVHKRPDLNDVTQAIIYETPDSRYGQPLMQKQIERTAKTQAVLMGGNVPHEIRSVGTGGQMVLPLEHEDWGHAHWKKVGPDEPGRDFPTWDEEDSVRRPAMHWGGRYAYETPADEERPMVTVRDRWRPSPKAKE